MGLIQVRGHSWHPHHSVSPPHPSEKVGLGPPYREGTVVSVQTIGMGAEGPRGDMVQALGLIVLNQGHKRPSSKGIRTKGLSTHDQPQCQERSSDLAKNLTGVPMG